MVGGAFSGCQPQGVAPAFAEAGLVDPEGLIGVFAVAPFVLLIDHRRLNGLPAPRRWAELMDPLYRDQVVFSGWRRKDEGRHRQINTFFLLSMAKEFGLDGLARLVRNVPALLHSAQMPRLAGTDGSPGGIYVVPWSLAALCPRRSETEVVWPEDGALAYPLWLTVKTTHLTPLDVLIRHFHGPDLGRLLNDNRYPALCPEQAPALPAGARFRWLGWDFVRHPATAKLIAAVRQTFTDEEPRLCA
jgi:ABC-type Fe3+ transport system substrate-binding protein